MNEIKWIDGIGIGAAGEKVDGSKGVSDRKPKCARDGARDGW